MKQVPPIVVRMLSSKDVLRKYDLSSIRLVFTGAAPLGKETAEELSRLYPKWHIAQGYGTLLFFTPLLPLTALVLKPC